MASTIFPGLPAKLSVDIQTHFSDPGDSLFLTTIWRFYNQENNTKSLINRVEIQQDRTGIAFVLIFFNKEGCRQMRTAFARLQARFFHYHDFNWCKLEVRDQQEMQAVLNMIIKTQHFIGNSELEMKKIVSKL